MGRPVHAVLLASLLLAGCGGGGSDPAPVPQPEPEQCPDPEPQQPQDPEQPDVPEPPVTTGVIDLSHDGTLGNGFGDGSPGATELEAKRWQTFIATSHPAVTAVEVKLRKFGSGTFTPVAIELYATAADGKPAGEALARGLIPPEWITTEFAVVRTGLSYDGLVAGRQYAVVLTQGVLGAAHYEWLDQVKVDPALHFGKYTLGGGWVEESYGDAWLKVHVASRSAPPTRVVLYAAVKSAGNLEGAYPDARTGADFLAASRPKSLAGRTTHAFLSVSAEDSIAGMPARFGFPDDVPVVAATDETMVVADTWADLLDGSIKMTLSDAFGWTGNYAWWSGSGADGAYDGTSTNCSGWTDGSALGFARTGESNYADAMWIHVIQGTCSGPRWVLGVAY